MGETTVNKVVSIKTKRGNKKDMSYAPARWIEIPAVISGDGISFLLPFDEYPFEVEITGENETAGYWSGTLCSSGDSMEFDGVAGDYHITFISEESEYIGYFTIE